MQQLFWGGGNVSGEFMRMTRKIALYAVSAILAILLLPGCESYKKRPETLEDFEKPFGVVSTITESTPKNVNVFIDASGSMHGFTFEGSKFYNIIYTLISYIPEDANIQLYGFGRTSVELKGDLRSRLADISKRDFYSQSHTDLCKPFDEHIKDDPNSVNLIFTDMVQSTEHASGDRVVFARLLKGYLGDNGFLSLMATQADFTGDYFIEKGGGKITVSDGSTRPLYCLAFGHRKYAGFVQGKMEDLFEHSFEFGNTASNKLKCIDNVGGISDPEIFLLDDSSIEHPVSYFKLKKGHTDYLKITMAGHEDKFGRILDYDVAYMGKADTTYVKLPDGKGMVEVDSLAGDGKISFKLPFNQTSPGCYIIRLTFRKTLPGWISELSTNDDSKLENLNKTFMLETWMKFIMNSFDSYEHLATTQYYLSINRK